MSFLFFDPIRFRTIVMDQFLVLHFIQYELGRIDRTILKKKMQYHIEHPFIKWAQTHKNGV